MRKLTVIDSRTAGISGDMLLAALIDVGAELKAIERTLQLIPRFYSKCKSIGLESAEMKTHGFRARGVNFKISESEGEVNAQTFSKAISDIVISAGMSKKAIAFATGSAELLATVESQLHGSTLSETHLHEAGSTDTVADILGVAAACESLGIFESTVYATPVAVGGGVINFSHGTISGPAPATLEIAGQRAVPIVGGSENVELSTPTGITMLANLATTFTETYPQIVPEKVGYGAGKKELANAPNFVRIVLGQTGIGFSDTVETLETNLDDVSGEVLSYTLQRLLDSGARDAWITTAQFKKNRPGHVLHVLCDPADTERFSKIIMEETGTLGVRHQSWNRLILARDVKTVNVEVAGRKFEVRIKSSTDSKGRILRAKPEADDVQNIARILSMPAREVERIIEGQI